MRWFLVCVAVFSMVAAAMAEERPLGSGLALSAFLCYAFHMARPLRLEYPGALYHVTSRGNGRAKIFRSDKDRDVFLTIVDAVIQKYRWLLHA